MICSEESREKQLEEGRRLLAEGYERASIVDEARAEELTELYREIGHEVVVGFVEGDPDRPIITGQVYNAACRPPYAPDQDPTVSTWKSSSSKGDEGFNEIRFEDRAGEEQVFVHAEKDLDVRVGNDSFATVQRNRNQHVERDDFVHVDNNQESSRS